MQDGIYEGISFPEYEKIDAQNASKIVPMRRSPMVYKYHLEHPMFPTDAMNLGTFVHQLILEPTRINEFVIWGELKEQKVRRGEVWNTFQAANYGRVIVTRKEYALMVGICHALYANKATAQYLNAPGKTELTIVWTDPITGRRHKGRIDKLIKGATRDIMVDLKTARDSQPHKFGAQSEALSRHVQAAHYLNGYSILTGREADAKLMAVETKPPYESAVYRITDVQLDQGRQLLDELLTRIDECTRINYWPPVQDVETDLIFPSWAVDPDEDLGIEGLDTSGFDKTFDRTDLIEAI